MMFLNFFRRNEYFFCIKVKHLGDERKLNQKLINTIKRYFWWRHKRIEYFEPHVTKNQLDTFAIIGTAQSSASIKRTSLIFLLELYAHLEDRNIPTSSDFKKTTKTLYGFSVDIYKIPKKIK